MQLSRKQITFSQFFSEFLELRLNFEHFEKKDFGNCTLQKTWLGKCLKSLVWEDLSTSNIGNGRKHC